MVKKSTPREIAMNNYQSIVVGLLVFLIGLGASYKLVTTQLNKVKQQEAAMTEAQELKNVHTVKAGETLWGIAEKEIGSGYNAHDIAKANNIADPNSIEIGTELTIPSVAPILVQQGSVTSIQTTQVTLNDAIYTVQVGDTLWDISVRAYGDGYQWPQIAKTNMIAHPNLIYIGTTLTLPGK